jgi:hypothetical protein
MTATTIRLMHTGYDLRARRAPKARTSGVAGRIVRALPLLTVATVALSLFFVFA